MQSIFADLGGVSAGKFDLVEPALARLGADSSPACRIQPGKPLVFGKLARGGKQQTGQFFFGLPGNPISSAATFHLFAVRFWLRLLEAMKSIRDLCLRNFRTTRIAKESQG